MFRSSFNGLLLFSISVPMIAAQATHPREIPLKNWPTPLYWQAPADEKPEVAQKPDASVHPRTSAPPTPTTSLVFVGITPCRVVDTRSSQMFPAPFGAPSLTSGNVRTFPIQTGGCSIPSNALAYSFNVTVVPPGGVGYLKIWPTAAAPNNPPTAVTLDDITGDIRNNAAIVPAGISNGSVSALTNATTDLVIDINGYYKPQTPGGIFLGQFKFSPNTILPAQIDITGQTTTFSIMPAACTIDVLYGAVAPIQGGGGGSFIVSLQDNGQDTGLDCQFSSSFPALCTPSSPILVSAGDTLDYALQGAGSGTFSLNLALHCQ